VRTVPEADDLDGDDAGVDTMAVPDPDLVGDLERVESLNSVASYLPKTRR
jgi:hypothetical protein